MTALGELLYAPPLWFVIGAALLLVERFVPQVKEWERLIAAFGASGVLTGLLLLLKTAHLTDPKLPVMFWATLSVLLWSVTSLARLLWLTLRWRVLSARLHRLYAKAREQRK